jgi:NTE family protein
VSDRRPRVGLVLGAGGPVGHAFHVGVLDALLSELGWDARAADVIVGTSAGSIVGAGLRSGLGPDDMRRRALGLPMSAQGADIARRIDAALSAARRRARPARARARAVASPARLRRALRQPWDVRAGSLFSAVMPSGVVPGDHLAAPYDELWGPTWPTDPLWIVAVDLDVGRRVVFGRDGAPLTRLGPAVQASCAIPGYFEPVGIGTARYVDGGVHSTTNADLLTDADVDLVVISAPMSSVGGTPALSPRSAMRQIARRWVAGEVIALRGAGVGVLTIQPTAADAEVMAGDALDATKAPEIIEQVSASVRAHVGDPRLEARVALLRAAGRSR